MASVDVEIRRAGFALIELVVALALGMLTLVAVYSIYLVQSRSSVVQRDALVMQQEVRAVLDFVVRELRMAGYDPAHVNHDDDPANDFYGVAGDADRLIIKADLNGDGRLDDANEHVILSYDPLALMLRRDTGGGRQPFGQHIQAFSVEFFDDRGSLTTVPARIRRVRVMLAGRTDKPDPRYPRNNGYRTYTVSATVAPRNLGF